MRDILFTVHRQRKEARLLLLCFLTACAVNLLSILYYDTEWKEIYNQFLWVIVLSFIFYIILLMIRVLIHFIRKLKK